MSRRPHFFQHAGFRIVSGSGPKQTSCMDSPPPHVGNWDPSTNKRQKTRGEEEEELGRELLAHYGSAEQLFGGSGLDAALVAPLVGFESRLAELVAETARRLGVPTRTVLDVGCSVGGASFALAKHFEAVMGIDLSHEFVTAATSLKHKGCVHGRRRDEGHVGSDVLVGPDCNPAVRERVVFRQMDPCCLAADMGPYDVVLVNSVLDRVPAPKSCLGRMGGERPMVSRGGLLVVASSYSWSENVADKKLWLGGVARADGTSDSSPEHLKAYLAGEGFDLLSVSLAGQKREPNTGPLFWVWLFAHRGFLPLNPLAPAV